MGELKNIYFMNFIQKSVDFISRIVFETGKNGEFKKKIYQIVFF